jgi:hypothetical protein
MPQLAVFAKYIIARQREAHIEHKPRIDLRSAKGPLVRRQTLAGLSTTAAVLPDAVSISAWPHGFVYAGRQGEAHCIRFWAWEADHEQAMIHPGAVFERTDRCQSGPSVRIQ